MNQVHNAQNLDREILLDVSLLIKSEVILTQCGSSSWEVPGSCRPFLEDNTPTVRRRRNYKCRPVN